MTKESPSPETGKGTHAANSCALVLYNDDFNTFEFVIRTLIDVCEHDRMQAEQCALVTHYNGKCVVKTGNAEMLNEKRQVMTDLGLTVEVN
jgi:ATP-dependent Clp protease adaptor protein ClpS